MFIKLTLTNKNSDDCSKILLAAEISETCYFAGWESDSKQQHFRDTITILFH